MIHFRHVAQLDVFPVLPTLFKNQPASWPTVAALGGASKMLRCHKDVTSDNWLEDLPVRPEPILDNWKSLQRLLARARVAIMDEHRRMLEAGVLRKVILSGEMGRAMLARLDPGAATAWRQEDGAYAARVYQFHLPLVTNPAAVLYAGPEMVHIEVGSLFYMNTRIANCAANWGPFYRLHLVIDMYAAVEEAAPADEGV